MPLTGPMHAIPGELLVSTETPAVTDNNPRWRVPTSELDISDHKVLLLYGDIWLVIACWHEWPNGKPEHWFDIDVKRESPALLFHIRTNKVFRFADIEDVGWLWRPL